jgi:hypothetical protein
MKNLSDEQKEELAKCVVDSWDMDTLVQFAIDVVLETYMNDDEAAKNDALDLWE